jgi:hypothetical protein
VQKKQNRTVFSILILIGIAVSCFIYTVHIRKSWNKKFVINGLWHWDHALALKYVKNWYNEGPFKLRFGMIENPSSVEFSSLKSRGLYISFPSGCLIPVYLISLISGHEPSLLLLRYYSLFNHLLITLFLTFTVFFILKQAGYNEIYCTLFSIIPIIMELFLPGPLYWHHSVYFVSSAAILPFTLLIFLEVIRKNFTGKNIRTFISILQAIVLFSSSLSEYIFIFAACIIILKRIIFHEFRSGFKNTAIDSLVFLLPVFAAIFLYFVQIYLLDAFNIITDSFSRSSILIQFRHIFENNYHFNKFWKIFIVNNFGKPAIYLLWGSLISLILLFIYSMLFNHKDKEKILDLSLYGIIILLPCFVHTYIFAGHSLYLEFTAIIFSIPLATIPFILIPVLISLLIDKKHILVPLVILCIVSLYTFSEYPKYKKKFGSIENSRYPAAEFINKNTSYNDIVFSPTIEIRHLPPILISISMKRVYKTDKKENIYNSIKNIKKDYILNILIENARKDETAPDIRSLFKYTDNVIKNDNFTLYKISKKKLPFNQETQAAPSVSPGI